jgi:hypothetical protein
MAELPQLTLEQFIKQLKGDADRFAAWWADCVKRGDVLSELTTMDEADWFEQFMLFCDDDGVEVH